MEWSDSVPYAAIGVICLLLGYALGLRRSRALRRRVLRQFNDQSLALLDANAALSSLQNYTSQQGRKDNLLKLVLRKLNQANQRCEKLQQKLVQQNNRHYVQLARLRLRAVEFQETARKAAGIARRATAHLRRLEQASPVTQTIEAPEPKSYGTGDPVTVSVVDQAHLDNPREVIAPVSNRDSARLSKLHSSNEATAPTG